MGYYNSKRFHDYIMVCPRSRLHITSIITRRYTRRRIIHVVIKRDTNLLYKTINLTIIVVVRLVTAAVVKLLFIFVTIHGPEPDVIYSFTNIKTHTTDDDATR